MFKKKKQLTRQPTKAGLLQRVFSFSSTPVPADPSDSDKKLSSSSTSSSSSNPVIDVVLPNIEVGQITELGFNHDSNEDFFTYVENLLEEHPGGDEYRGTVVRGVTFVGVYDGHGGDHASEFAHENLHVNLAKELWKGNHDDFVGKSIHDSFIITERGFTKWAKEHRSTAGSCSTCVVIKGNKVYCGNAGDSKAMYFRETKPKSGKPTGKINLCERHNTDSKTERARIKAAGGEISKDGSIYGVLFPSRGFGDLDVKANGKPVVIATPEGFGIEPQPPLELDPKLEHFILIASDGLWDFATDEECMNIALSTKGSLDDAVDALRTKARAGGSEDDITILLLKLTFD